MQNIYKIIHYFIYVIPIIIIGLSLTSCEDTFYFNPKPIDKTVVEGKRIVIECGVSNTDHISIHWNHNNNKIIYDSRRYQENGNLVIVFAHRVQDLGQFTCVATNVTSGHSIQQTIELKVFWISEVVNVDLITSKLISQSSNESEIILNCETNGNPEPKSEWFLNGIKLHRSEHLTIRHKKLHISKVSTVDNGIYSCRASNNAGKVDSFDNFVLNIKNESVPHLESISKNSIVKINTSITLNCSYANAASIEWYAPNKDVPLINNSRINVFPNGSLTISNIEKNDSGFYRCVAIPLIKDSETQTYSTRLQIAVLDDFDVNHFGPSFAPNLQMHVVPKNSPNFELYCIPPNGIPKPRLWWEDPNGSVISDSGRIRIEENNLIIEGPIKKSDSGKYTCVAENMAAQTRKVSELYVASPPTVSDPLSTVVDEDGVAVLHCLYSASPYTSVKWIKDGKYLRPSLHYLPQNNGSLIIRNSQISDSGKYECEVNSTGFQPIRTKEANLTIREKLKFLNIPTNKNLELMSNAKLVCKARGASPTIVKWVKWTKDGIPWFEWPAHIHDANGTLHFNGVKRQDSGNYTCIATNAQGIINASVEVSVIVMPKFTILPQSESEAMEGYTTLLHCKAEGEPNPTIQWDKDNVLNGFDHQRFTVMPNGTLQINEVHIEDSGKYGCTAGNSGGFKRTEVTLTVNNAENYSLNHLGVNTEENNSKMTRTVTITLGAAALYMFLVMALMVYCRYRRAKRKAASLVQTSVEPNKRENGDLEMKERNNAVANPEQHRLLSANDDRQKHICNKNSISVRNEGDVNSQTSSSHSSKRSKSPYEKLQFPRHDLQKLCLLGHGEFGDVFLAKSNSAKNLDNGQIVMVKALQSKEENIHFDYRREIEMFHKLSHERIVKLIGLCREADPFLMILEYSDWGDLKQFLLATRDDNMRRGPKPTALTFPQIIGISQQIAFGMEYLTSNRFVHKDLATRNCIITSKLDIKISSTSLSKDTYSVEYFNYQNRDIPIRWAPYEAVIEDEWSAKSDVYSFAVLIWEICSQAELPFYDKPDSAIVHLLQKNELKLDPPKAIPNLLRDLLMTCWSTSPKDRPTFTDVCHNLNQVLLNIHI